MKCRDLIVLSVDTATPVCSVALVHGDRVLGETLVCGQKNHSEKLLALIDALFENTQVQPGSIDLIAVSTGPGSFTGLRVGISTAQGLAFSLGKDLVGVSTLHVLAHQVPVASGFVCPVIDARKRQVYTCLYRFSQAGLLEKVIDTTVVEPETWIAQLPAPVTFLGDGAWTYHEMIAAGMPGAFTLVPRSLGIPRASTLAGCGLEQLAREGTDRPENIVPLYCRPPDAEKNRGSRKGSFNFKK